jgi:opacity protein-like surface antigen
MLWHSKLFCPVKFKHLTMVSQQKNAMKKILLLGCSCLAFGAGIKAQDSTNTSRPKADFHRVEFGFRFMPTFSAFDMKTSSGGTVNSEVTLGLGVGGFVAFNFTNHMGMQVELIYNSLSQKYQDADLERKIKVQYVNVPILFSLSTGKGYPVNLNLVAGPQFGYNIGSSTTTSGGSNTDTLQFVLATKQSDFGFAYGAGLEFNLNPEGTIRLDVGFRGVYGFANIKDSDASNTNGDVVIDRASVRTYSGYLGFAFLF